MPESSLRGFEDFSCHCPERLPQVQPQGILKSVRYLYLYLWYLYQYGKFLKWLPMQTWQVYNSLGWYWSQFPRTQWNLMGCRWSSVDIQMKSYKNTRTGAYVYIGSISQPCQCHLPEPRMRPRPPSPPPPFIFYKKGVPHMSLQNPKWW